MNDFLKDIQNTFMARVKNMLLLNFIIAWCIVNYKIVLRLLFEDTDINIKIAYFESTSIGWWDGFWFPLIIAAVYIYLIPFLNLYVVKIYNKFINKKIQEHQNETKKEYFIGQKEVEREKLETTIFLKDTMELEKKSAKLEQEKEMIELAERKNQAIEKSIKLEEQMLKIENEKMINIKQDISELENKYKEYEEKIKIVKETYNKEKAKKLLDLSKTYEDPKVPILKSNSSTIRDAVKKIYDDNTIAKFDLTDKKHK